MIDFQQDPKALLWAEGVLGVSFKGTPATWLTSLDQQGTILGVVIFSRFTTGNCEITVVARNPRFITKTFAFAVAYYPFIQLGLRRVTAIIAVENVKSLRLAQRLGFRNEGTLKNWFSSGDAHILGLLREDCTFVKDLDNGQPGTTANT